MKAFVDLSGLDNLIGRVNQIQNLDATPLMATWMKIITDDNRKGVLAGLDKDGRPMAPVTYRPVGPKKSHIKINSAKAANLRNGVKPRGRGVFAGFGPAAAGLHNNLTPGEYRKLTGPPLAPRGMFSRVITNLQTTFVRESSSKWFAVGAWIDVVSTKGVAFLGAHFKGDRVGRRPGFRLPVRDLRGVRPEGREKARKAAIAWMTDQVRFAATGSRNQSAA